ncbi:unnamed protein product [Periconia digitata]|uniref:Enoyl reductase (ER) domain-containing protein n=1 Tax=Periconia digitata TaxID=1303443 RepID=A0A9W4XG19_9PLEO|nr:unnamed protein product [Periconia digitata]
MSSTTPETTAELHLTQQGGPFKLTQVPNTPSPPANQARLRLHAIGLNLLDKKQLDYGLFIPQYPFVLGGEGAGIVEAVGPDVKDFQPGDEVIAILSGKMRGFDWGGAYAERSNVLADGGFFAARKPRNVGMGEAASLPVGYLTAVAVIAGSFGTPLAFLPELENAGVVPSSVLVLGGSSVTGAAAIQLLRYAYPSMPIYATSSRHNFDQVKAVGATEVFDYHSPSIVADIKAQTPGSKGVDTIFDFVAAGASQTDICDVLDPAGLKQYGAVVTGVDISVPDGVKYAIKDAYDVSEMKGGGSVFPMLTQLVEEGKYKLPVEVKIEGHGLESIPQAVEKLPKVSGAKLVITL